MKDPQIKIRDSETLQMAHQTVKYKIQYLRRRDTRTCPHLPKTKQQVRVRKKDPITVPTTSPHKISPPQRNKNRRRNNICLSNRIIRLEYPLLKHFLVSTTKQ